jgi:hypothetical protein
MGLDIRWPIGLMFSLIGILLAVFGLAKPDESMSLTYNINLIWGVVLLFFGALMLLGAIMGGKKLPAA